MKKNIRILLFTVFVLLSTTAYTKNIVVLGDSISAAYGINIKEGWVHLLQQKLDNSPYKQYKLINASISGSTTGDGLTRLPTLLKMHKPHIVIIELGGNDGLRGYPVKLMQRNLQNMIMLSEKSKAKVLLAGIEIPPNYGQRYTQLFRESFNKVANGHDVAYLPFILDKVATQPELMQEDGIHPTAKAQPRLMMNIWRVLKTML